MQGISGAYTYNHSKRRLCVFVWEVSEGTNKNVNLGDEHFICGIIYCNILTFVWEVIIGVDQHLSYLKQA